MICTATYLCTVRGEGRGGEGEEREEEGRGEERGRKGSGRERGEGRVVQERPVMVR